jgi:hypothetical protein
MSRVVFEIAVMKLGMDVARARAQTPEVSLRMQVTPAR